MDDDLDAARKSALSQHIDLDTLSSLLEQKQAEQAALSRNLEASSSALDTLLEETTVSLIQLNERAHDARTSFLQLEDELLDHRDVLVSPLHMRNKADGLSSSATATGFTLLETLENYHKRINDLERAQHMFGYLAKAEELSLIAKEQIKLPTSRQAVETYCELVNFTHKIYDLVPSTSGALAMAPFVRDIAASTWKEIVRALEAKLVATLDGISWPSKKVHDGQLDYAYEARAKAFKSAFMNLLSLEQTGLRNPLPRSETAAESSNDKDACLLAISALSQPLILRFRYHFDGKRQTNRLDKPEWYFAHILNALSDHEAFVRTDIQLFVNEGGFKDVDAMTDFTTALLRPISRKIRSSVPQLLGLPSILAHTIYQALQFDEKLRESAEYRPRCIDGSSKEWKGTADIILGNEAWFDGWKDAEKKFIDDKYYEIIGSPEAWHINEDYSSSSDTRSSMNNLSAYKPTNSALRIKDLFEQVTDRYKALPDFKLRLPFLLDIQISLITNYYERISSATDAFETLSFGIMRSVPGSLVESNLNTRMTNGISGLQRLIRANVSCIFMKEQLKSWSGEDPFFLEMWQEIRQESIRNPDVKRKCTILYDPAALAGKAEMSGVLDSFIYSYGKLASRTEELIVKHINREVTGELKSYLGRRWDRSFEPINVPESSSRRDSDVAQQSEAEVSPDLVSALTVFSALLSALSSSFPLLPLNKIYRSITSPLQELLLARSVLPKIWSESGGQQFLIDVEKGWIKAVEQAAKGKLRRPENGFRKILDAAKLVSLPASTSISGGNALAGQTIPISRVVQVTWDDANDSAFLETLDKLGVREIVGRKEVKAILRKRPECWR